MAHKKKCMPVVKRRKCMKLIKRARTMSLSAKERKAAQACAKALRTNLRPSRQKHRKYPTNLMRATRASGRRLSKAAQRDQHNQRNDTKYWHSREKSPPPPPKVGDTRLWADEYETFTQHPGGMKKWVSAGRDWDGNILPYNR